MPFRSMFANAGGVRQRPGEGLKQITVREFGGGWNVIDNDLNLSSRFSKILRNFLLGEDGSLQLRWGTKLFASLSFIDEIIDCTYFSNVIVAVGKNGKIGAVLGDGTVYEIWNDEIAATKSGSPAGWTAPVEFVAFTQFRGELILTNGIDKPLIINSQLQVTYLADLGAPAGPTNVNTPVTRYVTSSDRYTVMAGDPLEPSLLHISATDTSGTWFGDTAPNDAVQLELGQYVDTGSRAIKGIASFREKLIVSFEEVLVVVQLGTTNSSGDHDPQVEDVIKQYGSISHRVIQSLGDDILFTDIVGVPSLKRNLFTEQLKPERVSELIDPNIQKRLKRLSTASLEDRVFAIYDRVEGTYIVFVPNNSSAADITETIGYAYRRVEALKVKAWSELRGWNWRAACRSAQGRIFFAKNNQLFLWGANDDEFFGDFINDQETFSDDTVFTDGTGWAFVGNPNATNDSGLPIAFDWQLPWADLDNRMTVKTTRYVGLDTKGDAQFDLEMFVDNILVDREQLGEAFTDDTRFSDGYGWENEEPIYNPTLSMKMAAGDSTGFGLQPFGFNKFGGGRVTSDERLYAWTAKFKLQKMRVHGEDRKRLQIISMSLGYLDGSIRR